VYHSLDQLFRPGLMTAIVLELQLSVIGQLTRFYFCRMVAQFHQFLEQLNFSELFRCFGAIGASRRRWIGFANSCER